MVDLSPRAQALKQQLLRRYLDSLPAKRAELDEAWQAARSEQTAAQGLAQMKSLVHRLAGSAGSYGLDGLNEAAQALNKALADIGSPAGQLGDIEAYVEDLLSALDNDN